MKIAIPLMLSLTLLVGCATTDRFVEESNRYKYLISQPTPKSWQVNEPWLFTASEKQGKSILSMTLKFTDKPADSCTAGDWRQIDVIEQSPAPSAQSIAKPAYILEGEALTISLTSNICDVDVELKGELTDNGFSGKFNSGGMMSGEVLGPASGHRISNP
jgi:hypothetical protein